MGRGKQYSNIDQSAAATARAAAQHNLLGAGVYRVFLTLIVLPRLIINDSRSRVFSIFSWCCVTTGRKFSQGVIAVANQMKCGQADSSMQYTENDSIDRFACAVFSCPIFSPICSFKAVDMT